MSDQEPKQDDTPDYQIPYPERYAAPDKPAHTVVWTRKNDGTYQKKEKEPEPKR